ncbi:uncharacterized protein LOC127839606 [Dreissena polymorpha]|uniref:uncharacterized protein LOC127839606 n=1 Tax=Dreissena polymorpha TaxID=45954 RepID=UPI0022652C25|nr:uncharacterized protein LOC127839606 [Dreissena polymorpha]
MAMIIKHQECYMDQVVTETFNTVYRGGCRRREISTIRWCAKHVHYLCNYIPVLLDNTNRSLCYFCDSSKSVQASVSNPSDCITLTTCDTDQVCFSHNEYHPGLAPTFKYGCQNKYICRLLMKRVFEDLRHCAGAGASGPECQHETLNCDVCCGDEACNYGDCRQLKARLYNLMVIGKFNNVTLQVIP